ncbi:MAG: putative Ig domain-containing protein, partial [Candidatus Thermoplasmatota archaeon]
STYEPILNPGIDIGNDSIYEWKYEGIGYGKFGEQYLFSDGDEVKNLSITNYDKSTKIKLPNKANVSTSSLELAGIDKTLVHIGNFNFSLGAGETHLLPIPQIPNFTKVLNATLNFSGEKKLSYEMINQSLTTTTTGIFGSNYIAQTFKAEKDGEIYRVEAKTYKPGNPAGNFTCNITKLNATDQPDIILGSAEILPSGVIHGGFSIWNFTDVHIKKGEKYGIVFSSQNSTDLDQYAIYYKDTNPYTDGNELISSNGGKTWTVQSNFDLTFKLHINYFDWLNESDIKKIKISHNGTIKYGNSSYTANEISLTKDFEIKNENIYDIKINFTCVLYYALYPGDVILKLRYNGNEKEILNRTGMLDGKIIVPDFSTKLNSILSNSKGEKDLYGNELVFLELSISSSEGKILIQKLKILYKYELKLFGFSEIINLCASSSGKIKLSNLILNYNIPPSILSKPIEHALVGTLYEYIIDATDEDNDTLNYKLEKSPNGMIIKDNKIKWMPTEEQVGNHTVKIIVSDSFSNATQTFNITVKKKNTPPEIKSEPKETGVVGSNYTYNVKAKDDDNDSLKFILLDCPEGMSIDNNGTINWLPSKEGSYNVSVKVSDNYSSVYQNFTITVKKRNNPPIIKSKANGTAIQGILYEYKIIAEDLDNDNLTYKIIEPPNGMKIYNNKISWLPLSIGNYSVKIEVSDGYDIVNQSFKINVLENSKPIIKPIPKKNLKVGEIYKYKVIAEDKEGLKISYSLVLFPKGMEIDENGTIFWKPEKEGEYKVVVNVSDGFNNVSQEFYIKVEKTVVPIPIFPMPLLIAIIFFVILCSAIGVYGYYRWKKIEKKELAEEIFIFYKDGKLIAHQTTRTIPMKDKERYVREVCKMIEKYLMDVNAGKKGITASIDIGTGRAILEYGKYLYALSTGDESKRVPLRNAIKRIEVEYEKALMDWDGDYKKLAGIDRLIQVSPEYKAVDIEDKPIEAIKIFSAPEFYMGYLRMKIAVVNDMNYVITDASLKLVFDENVFHLSHTEPEYPLHYHELFIGNVNPREKKTVNYYLDPMICTSTFLDATLTYKDYLGNLKSTLMPRKRIELTCPIFYTEENINVGILKKLIKEMEYYDRKIYKMPSVEPEVMYNFCKEVISAHDVRFVKEFKENGVYEAWYYGKTRDKKEVVIKVGVSKKTNTIEFFVSATAITIITGLLAELGHELTRRLKGRGFEIGKSLISANKEEVTKKLSHLIDKYSESEL